MNRSRRLCTDQNGFSIVELAVVVAIVSTLAALSLSATLNARKREQINTVTIGLAGWIEEVRRSAMRGNQCEITISTGSISGSGVIGQARPGITIPDSCWTKVSPEFRIPEQAMGQTYTLAATSANIIFTPRGTKLPATDITITVTSSNGGPSRCIKLISLLGNLEMGNASGGTCNTNQRF